jgi:hypothetical protein
LLFERKREKIQKSKTKKVKRKWKKIEISFSLFFSPKTKIKKWNVEKVIF